MARFIPVYTGNTIDYHQLMICFAVYPCVYREHEIRREKQTNIAGLSLCIQGTLKENFQEAHQGRFIPVYTGNTLLYTGSSIL